MRRIAAGSHYEALGETEFPGSRSPPDGLGASPVGFLHGALLAQAAGHAQEAETLFARSLELPQTLPENDDLWLPLTAFAAVCSAASAAAFEAFLARHGMHGSRSLASLPLPARSNFLRFCLKHQKLDRALALIEHQPEQPDVDRLTLDDWGWRFGVLMVLAHAKQKEQFAAFAASCEELLKRGQVEPDTMRPAVEVLFATRLAEAAQVRGDMRTAIARLRDAIALVERGPAAGLTPGLLVSLLQRLGRIHQSDRYFPEAQRCLERSIGIASVHGCSQDLVASLYALANLLEHEGRHDDSLALHARRLAVMESDPAFSVSARQFARHDFARMLLACGDLNAGRVMLDELIAVAASAPSANQGLLVNTLLTRVQSLLAEDGAAAAAWQHVNEILGLPGLSATHLDRVAQMVLQIGDTAACTPPYQLVTRIATAAERLQDAEPMAAASVLAHIAAALLQSYKDTEAARGLLQRAIALWAANPAAAGSEQVAQRIREVKWRLLESTAAGEDKRLLVAHWRALLDEAGSFAPADWNKALSLPLDLTDRGWGETGKQIVTSLIGYFATGGGDRVEQAPFLLARLSELTLRVLSDPRSAEKLAQQGLGLMPEADEGERSVAVRLRLLHSLVNTQLAIGGELVAAKAEVELRPLIGEILKHGTALVYGHRIGLLRLADRLLQDGPSDLGATIVRSVAALPLPEGIRAADHADLCLRLSNSMHSLESAEEAARIARRGLDAIPETATDERSVALRQRLLHILTNAELVVAEALVAAKAQRELRPLIAEILQRGGALAYAHRVLLLRLADRLFQAAASDLGATIIRGVAALPPLTGRPDAAYLSGELYLRLSQVTLRRLKAHEQAEAWARQGLEAVSGGRGEKALSVRRRLLEGVLAAEIAAAEVFLKEGREADLRQVAERILVLEAVLRLPYRVRLARLAESAFAKKWRVAGDALLAGATQSLAPVSGPEGENPVAAGQLYVRLGQIMLRFKDRPDQAAQLARQGLEALAESDDEKCVAPRRQLRDLLAKAERLLKDGRASVATGGSPA